MNAAYRVLDLLDTPLLDAHVARDGEGHIASVAWSTLADAEAFSTGEAVLVRLAADLFYGRRTVSVVELAENVDRDLLARVTASLGDARSERAA